MTRSREEVLERYVAILGARFTNKRPTLAQVGEKFGISAGRVRQICDNFMAFHADMRSIGTEDELRVWALERGIEDVERFVQRYGWFR